MVPTDYRLDHVVAALIERLEGARRTFGRAEDDARAVFEETAEEHLDNAVSEYADVAMEEPGPHGAFLRREVRFTALPRYHRLAMDMNRAESNGFGFGWLAEPVGRFALIGGAVMAAMFLARLAAWPLVWPVILVVLTVPFWPSIGALLVRRRYHHEVKEIVHDMARIQDASRAYLLKNQLRASHELEDPPPRSPRPDQREGS